MIVLKAANILGLKGFFKRPTACRDRHERYGNKVEMKHKRKLVVKKDKKSTLYLFHTFHQVSGTDVA